MLNAWLREGENKIPPFATHLVGVAGLVLNAKKEVLLVKEQSKRISGWQVAFLLFYPWYFLVCAATHPPCCCRDSPSVHRLPSIRKLPGGFCNLGEEFGVAACREVEEETGVKCEFKSVLALRHQHNVAFGRSDMCVRGEH